MRKLIYILIISVAMIFALTFVYNNQDVVSVNYYGDQPWGFQWKGPLSLLLMVTVGGSLLIGYLFSILSNIKLRAKLLLAKRQIKKVSAE